MDVLTAILALDAVTLHNNTSNSISGKLASRKSETTVGLLLYSPTLMPEEVNVSTNTYIKI